MANTLTRTKGKTMTQRTEYEAMTCSVRRKIAELARLIDRHAVLIDSTQHVDQEAVQVMQGLDELLNVEVVGWSIEVEERQPACDIPAPF